MADKQIVELPIVELPELNQVTNETLIPVYQPGAMHNAQKMTGLQFRAFAEDAAKEAAGSIARGGTFTPQFNDATGYLSWTNDIGLPNPDPVQLEGVSSVNGKTGAVTVFNQNLLDNWYFADPVNQRGQTEYMVNGYTIDRWRMSSSKSTVTLTANGVTLNMPDQYVGLIQRVENPEQYRGKTLTASALVGSVEKTTGYQLVLRTGTSSGEYAVKVLTGEGLYSASFEISDDAEVVEVLFQSRVASAGNINIRAVKLELGSEQTLANQENGKWVLNDPPPDKGMELLKCCMSTADSTDTYANNKVTPAAINAVNKTGDTMTGDLTVSKSSPKVILSDSTSGRGGAYYLHSTEKVLYLINQLDSNNRNCLLIGAETESVNDLLRLYAVSNGSGKAYNILHTGNKPSGSYTGNGSATQRTIDVGGVGVNSAVLITSVNGGALITSGTSIGWSFSGGVVVIPYGQAHYISDFKLTLATADALLNANGVSYSYKVL